MISKKDKYPCNRCGKTTCIRSGRLVENGGRMKRVKFMLGVDYVEGILVKGFDTNENTVLVELLYEDGGRTGKVVKRHKVKHKVVEQKEVEDGG